MIALSCRLFVSLAFVAATAAQHQPAWTWLTAPRAPLESRTQFPLGFALAYDPLRGQVVLFGGQVDSTVRDETWEWAGSRWVRRALAASPSPRWHSAVAYDPVNRAILLFSGFSGVGAFPSLTDTWSYDGQVWTLLAPSTSPPARGGASMATDAVRNRIVLHGGIPMLASSTVFADTWEWNGANWIPHQPVHVPPPSWQGTMAFDASVGRVVLVNVDDKVREWNGQDWAVITPPTPLPVRYEASACTDPTGAGVLLFGGPFLMGIPTETWRWYGGSWSRRADPPVSFVRRSAVVAGGDAVFAYAGWSNTAKTQRYSAGTNQWSVAGAGPLVGGGYGGGQAVAVPGDGTLVMLQSNGQTWRIESIDALALGAPGAGPSSVTTMAWDSAHSRTLAIDGVGVTHAFDGQQWTPVASSSPPARLVGHHYGSGKFLAYAVSAIGTEVWGLDGNGWALLSTIPSAAGSWTTSAALDGGRDTLVLLEQSYAQSVVHEWNGTVVSRPAPNLSSATMLPCPTGGVVCWDYAACFRWDGSAWTPLPVSLWGALGCDIAGQRFFRTWGEWLHPFGLEVLPADPEVGGTVNFTLSEPMGPGRDYWLLLAADDSPGILLPSVAHGVSLRLPLANDWLLAASVTAGVFGTLDANGRATRSLAIPNSSGLLGFGFHAAALLLPSASGVMQVTNGVHVWVHR